MHDDDAAIAIDEVTALARERRERARRLVTWRHDVSRRAGVGAGISGRVCAGIEGTCVWRASIRLARVELGVVVVTTTGDERGERDCKEPHHQERSAYAVLTTKHARRVSKLGAPGDGPLGAAGP